MNRTVSESGKIVAESLSSEDLNGREATDVSIEPAEVPFLPAGSSEELTTADLEEAWRAARLFFLTGKRTSQPTTGPVIPAVLYAYRDASRFRGPYPICLPTEMKRAEMISDVVDAAIQKGLEDENPPDALQAIGHHVEAALRGLVEEGYVGDLGTLWESAMGRLLTHTEWPTHKKEEFRDVSTFLKSSLPEMWEVLPCDKDTIERILIRSAEITTDKKGAYLREEVERLLLAIREILWVDQSHSAESQTPDHLKASVGKAFEKSLDFDALSNLMESSHISDPLPATRKKRLQETVRVIEAHKKVLEPSDAAGRLVRIVADETEFASLSSQMTTHFEDMAELVRALHIAALEAENRYREDFHDDYFADFSPSRLTDEERAACPPFIVHIEIPDSESSFVPDLSGILVPGWPVKVLVSLPKIYEKQTSPLHGAVTPSPAARIAEQAVAFREAFVLQCPLSAFEPLQDGLNAGMKYDGPAVFSVFTGSGTYLPDLTAYLRSASAVEARAFPCFQYNPSAGPDWVRRFVLPGNPQPDSDFPIGQLVFRNQEDIETTESLAFTTADFLSADIRFEHHFTDLDTGFTDSRIVPFETYLNRDKTARDLCIPFVYRTDLTGRMIRTIVTREMANLVERVVTDWHLLRERGGIKNSFVAAAIEGKRLEMEEAKEEAISQLKAQHDAQLERATGDLAEEIVSRIASGLLGLGDDLPMVAAPAFPSKPTPRPKESEAGTSEETVVAETETTEEESPDEDLVSFDEPYIETVRCTTCNECTQINSLLFAYNENRQAVIRDVTAGTYSDLVEAAERCPVRIIHPGKPMNPDEPGLDALIERAKPFL